MAELADIVRRHGLSYLELHKPFVPAEQQRAIADIAACHTRQMGGVYQYCPECAFSQFIGFSCRNRACPRCHGTHAANWLEARLDEMLPVPYYHIVFTVPHSLHGLIRSNPKKLLALLVTSCAQSILQLAADPRWIGGQPAIMTVLHTAKRDLGYHPHVHCVVSAGGYDKLRKQWVVPPKPNFLFPNKVLGRVVREKLLDGIRACLPGCIMPKGMYKHDWVTHCEGTHGDSSHLVRYLARYVFRLPLCNGRIIEASDERVVYRYRPNGSRSDRLLKTDPHSFLERYLQHVLPKGFHAVRYWGIWTAFHRPRLRHLQQTLEPKHAAEPIPEASAATPKPAKTKPECCCRCGCTLTLMQIKKPLSRYKSFVSRAAAARTAATPVASAPP